MGVVVIRLKLSIPEALAQACEFGVGLMLVALGASLAMSLYRGRWHLHTHQHGEGAHLHLHSHGIHTDHEHPHWLQISVRPFLVGVVHGLAGSAALMLMVVSTIRTLWEGMAFILVFGIGSIIGMMLMCVLIGLPLVISTSYQKRVQVVVQGLASLGSIGLGLSMIARLLTQSH